MKRFTTTAGLLLCSLFFAFSVPTFTPKAEARTKTNAAYDFIDVNYGEWHTLSDDYMYLNGYMNGKSNTIFAPSSKISRAEMAQVLYNMVGSPEVPYIATYRDVPNGLWYTKACMWASKKGIINGTSTTTMNPAGYTTREQAATIIFRYADAIGVNVSERARISGFPDGNKVSAFAVDGMKWCVAAEIIRGSEKGGSYYLNPQSPVTRAEIAAMLCRLRLHVVNNPRNSPNGVHYHNTAGTFLDIPHMLQTDPRWSQNIYGDRNIQTNACGPTAMAMVESYLKKAFISPETVVNRIGNSYWEGGTKQSFFKEYPANYGFHSKSISTDPKVIADYVNTGNPVICHMAQNSCFGYNNGHYVVIRSITKYGCFLILDPFSEERCEIYYTPDMISRSIKGAWAFY